VTHCQLWWRGTKFGRHDDHEGLWSGYYGLGSILGSEGQRSRSHGLKESECLSAYNVIAICRQSLLECATICMLLITRLESCPNSPLCKSVTYLLTYLLNIAVDWRGADTAICKCTYIWTQ